METTQIPAAGLPTLPGKKRTRRILLWTFAGLLLVLILLGIGAQIAIDRAAPLLRARVIETLSTRFDSRVELDRFEVSVFRGFEVEGGGLRLYPHRFLTTQPLIAITRFSFRASWRSLFETPMHVAHVTVEGMAINIPPKDERLKNDRQKDEYPSSQPPLPGTIKPADQATATPPAAANPATRPGIKIVVDEVLIQNVRLLIGTSKPGKLPLDFEIHRILLTSVGPGRPMKFDAILVNPKPIGDIHSSGYFGPFREDSPGESQVSGSYVFSHADLATFKGIGGILSSTGKYQGPLNRLVVDGQADVPDFRLSTGDHPMPLHTVFHAIVDGTDGDTYLQPVQAQLAHSHFTVNGSVVRVPAAKDHPHGHDITLDVVMDGARIEDFLRLAVHSDPPVLNGDLRMNARIFLPPGDIPVPQKIQISGRFDVMDGLFSSDKIQKKINELSHIGSGHPKDPDLHVSYPQPEDNVPAGLNSDFTLSGGILNFPNLDFNVPGAQIDLNGIYSLDGSKFDFHGKAKLRARPSQMTTGWKSALLTLADPFFAKQGYGTVVPIEINGTKSDPHFGLDFGHK